ncbi:LOW QUALITY PROTEIN: actin-histidine N-methyltransferase-like [Cottoperca gobio]|uniref:protein-histidine N-methyltransferase n=1 Tax=Cottoperca gobio TaxID=56716 RepID=A0A6J2S1M1_COTGO|nr:LOW QUALITY PROTEIN: actin-histidine N-methyltransferase-like [Cottoperca gobio]
MAVEGPKEVRKEKTEVCRGVRRYSDVSEVEEERDDEDHRETKDEDGNGTDEDKMEVVARAEDKAVAGSVKEREPSGLSEDKMEVVAGAEEEAVAGSVKESESSGLSTEKVRKKRIAHKKDIHDKARLSILLFIHSNMQAEHLGREDQQRLQRNKKLVLMVIGPARNPHHGAALASRANPDSSWLPYIRSLPLEYDTPLFYQQDEVQVLLGTQAVQDVLSQYKNTARQYAYFYKLVQTHPAASKLPLKDSFTFDDYRWAVSSVMTRQNQIPTEDGSRITLALIPVWDMCNHTNGLITTGYNLEDDRCECVALQDYKENEQIYIFYGTRSNAEFVIHNGFFFQDNAHDRVKIKLGVSKSERLYAMKAEVLARAGIPASCIFALHCNEPPISAQLLAFLRVFCMTEEELNDYLLGDRAINKIFTLGNSEFPVSWENEIKLWTFLETRAALLLKTYKTTSQEDRSTLENPDLSLHSRVSIQLRMAEKQILEKASASGRAKRLCFEKKLEEGAPLPVYEESDIALLENTDADAKLPIILRKLKGVEEDQEVQVEEHSHFLNGDKAVYAMDMEANGESVQEVTQEKVSRDVDSALDLIGSSTPMGRQEVADLSASRTEDNPKENSQ